MEVVKRKMDQLVTPELLRALDTGEDNHPVLIVPETVGLTEGEAQYATRYLCDQHDGFDFTYKADNGAFVIEAFRAGTRYTTGKDYRLSVDLSEQERREIATQAKANHRSMSAQVRHLIMMGADGYYVFRLSHEHVAILRDRAERNATSVQEELEALVEASV